ncbi:MAG: 2-(R)-hydroxypropyl-CoM dehydrogenase [Smithella sp. PtaU1.Bin162]|jgi:NAD(P)-dependent dehydrogenase (short-subunit alcohol dehydrogenase family)|nr:MAG: 2-(R)-hydroxypropyl-CoM dehydrogenase [Smithella sp. PtaU1.Bin162]
MGDRLKGKVAIVTGAGSVGPGWGNGKATAVLFAREGAKVFAVDMNLTAAQETKSIIDKEGGLCAVHQTNVTNAAEVREMVEKCIRTFDRVDILHNNVGIVEVGGPVEITEENWDKMMAVNIKSMFLTCKYCLPYMEKQGAGSIVNISSIGSIRYIGYPSVSYCATKGAVNQLTQNVAIQYAAKGIRANSVLPGLMNTPMIQAPLKKTYAEGDIEKMIEIRNQQCPTKKMGDAWDVAYASLFLASDEARYITGIQLVVDGGITCKFS